MPKKLPTRGAPENPYAGLKVPALMVLINAGIPDKPAARKAILDGSLWANGKRRDLGVKRYAQICIWADVGKEAATMVTAWLKNRRGWKFNPYTGKPL